MGDGGEERDGDGGAEMDGGALSFKRELFFVLIWGGVFMQYMYFTVHYSVKGFCLV